MPDEKQDELLSDTPKRIITVAVPADQEPNVTGKWEAFVGSYARGFAVLVCIRPSIGPRDTKHIPQDRAVLVGLLDKTRGELLAMFDRVQSEP